MPDLFSHMAAARLPASFLRDPRLAALVVIGTFLPDLAAKGVYWVLWSGDFYDAPSHGLVGILLLSYAGSLFLEEGLRAGGFRALAAGGLIHAGLDILKDTFDIGGPAFFYPFSTRCYGLGLLDPINPGWLFPIDVALLLAAWAIERRRRRVRQ